MDNTTHTPRMDNPRIQCHDCGKWMRLMSKDEQLFFGGDSACGCICVKCIEKHKENGTYVQDRTICKRDHKLKLKDILP